jgi:hypothetical protein
MMKVIHDIQDDENYCECCLQPAGTAIKPYFIFCKTETMDSAGSGIPMFFILQKYFLRLLVMMSIIGLSKLFIPGTFTFELGEIRFDVIDGMQYLFYFSIPVITIYTEIFLKLSIA